MEKNQKPPTQGVGVEGFRADLYASDIEKSEETKKIEWHILIHLPKFQMFAIEHSQSKYGDVGNVMEWITGYIQDMVQSNGEQDFFGMYMKWHGEKDYWKNEDMYGKLL
jgi:hypothetical protein